MSDRNFSTFDKIIINLDTALASVFGNPAGTGRQNPADKLDLPELTKTESKISAGLMRVNHTGEVCAQALYQGQALAAHKPQLREDMQQASDEENDHLNWCRTRLTELDSHTSYINPFWYAGSFVLGVSAGLVGDKWSLGFVAETERQVVEHLQGHLQKLPENDSKSRAIVAQMKIDEAQHATHAVNTGAADLPKSIKKLMAFTSKLMTKTSYWI